MKVNNLALSAIGLVSLAAAQNGNDPLILNNRTGLSPVVYNTFSTSYTKSQFSEPPRERFLQALPVTVPIMPSSIQPSSYDTKSAASAECWRNGYPCNQNGSQRIRRRIANLAHATTTSAIDESSVETSEAIFSILPISTPSPSTEKEGAAILPANPISEKISATSSELTLDAEVGSVEARKAGVPVDWWRGPGQPVDPEGPAGPTQHRPAHHPDFSVDCSMHYCPNWRSGPARSTFPHVALSTTQTSVTNEVLPTVTGVRHSVALPAVPILVD